MLACASKTCMDERPLSASLNHPSKKFHKQQQLPFSLQSSPYLSHPVGSSNKIVASSTRGIATIITDTRVKQESNGDEKESNLGNGTKIDDSKLDQAQGRVAEKDGHANIDSFSQCLPKNKHEPSSTLKTKIKNSMNRTIREPTSKDEKQGSNDQRINHKSYLHTDLDTRRDSFVRTNNSCHQEFSKLRFCNIASSVMETNKRLLTRTILHPDEIDAIHSRLMKTTNSVTKHRDSTLNTDEANMGSGMIKNTMSTCTAEAMVLTTKNLFVDNDIACVTGKECKFKSDINRSALVMESVVFNDDSDNDNTVFSEDAMSFDDEHELVKAIYPKISVLHKR